MCLIAYHPEDCEGFTKSVFKNGWRNNKDGAGYMFTVGGRLHIRKPFWSMRDLWKAYKMDHSKYGVESPFVVHFRWSTHGELDALNTHPHSLCDGKIGLVHNGILDSFEPGWKSPISDTVFFCRTVLACREPEQIMSESFNRVLAEMIGTHNKFVMMDGTGHVSIVNHESGEWAGSHWYSNKTYIKSAESAKTPYGYLDGWGLEGGTETKVGWRKAAGLPELPPVCSSTGLAIAKRFGDIVTESYEDRARMELIRQHATDLMGDVLDNAETEIDLDQLDELCWREAMLAAEREDNRVAEATVERGTVFNHR